MAASRKIRTVLVELRTSVGPVYAQPSFWERLYLLWIFRNFRCLPREVLGHRQRRLVDKLCRTAVRQPSIAHSAIIGIVENVAVTPASKPEIALTASNVIEMVSSTAEIGVQRAVAVGGTPIRWEPPADRNARTSADLTKVEVISPSGNSACTGSGNGERDFAVARTVKRGVLTRRTAWILAAASVATAVGVLLRLPIQARPSSPAIVSQPAVPDFTPAMRAPITPVAVPEAVPSAAVSDPVRTAVASDHNLATVPAPSRRPEHLSTDQAVAKLLLAAPPVTDDDSTQESRLQITQPPESGFRYPEAPASSLTGKVSLKAIIGTDGAVVKVDVLSGNRALAAAAVQAVRHWRYAVPELDGHPVEAETNVAINFLGDDAVSVTFPAAR